MYMSKITLDIGSSRESFLPDEIYNEKYFGTNEIVYNLMFHQNPNLSKENKDNLVKYGIIREQRDKSLCERLQDMFLDVFKLAE